MWLKVGIPALVLVVLIAARLVYYVFWRRHWDGRPVGSRRGEGAETEVIVIGAEPVEKARPGEAPKRAD